jgi:hypothetical protein
MLSRSEIDVPKRLTPKTDTEARFQEVACPKVRNFMLLPLVTLVRVDILILPHPRKRSRWYSRFHSWEQLNWNETMTKIAVE